MSKTLYLIDGHAQIYRAFYAPFRDLTSPSGEPTKATHVFCQMLLNLIRDRRPDYLAMAMDVSDGTVFRKKIDENYKANREPAPQELHIQADRIVDIVSTLGVPILKKSGFEADDLIATVVEQLSDHDVDIYLVSRDKDFEQLLSNKVFLFDVSKALKMDPDRLQAEKGYAPKQAIDIQTLSGDSTDNIPGVQGIGTKTAAKLIGQYGSAQNVVDHADELTPKMRERVLAFSEQMPITRQLVTLKRDVPMNFDLDACKADNFDFSAIEPTFKELGLTRLRDSLSVFTDATTVSSQQESARLAATSSSGSYVLVNTIEKLQTLADQLKDQAAFALDTETTGLDPFRSELVGLSISFKSGEAYYLPVKAPSANLLTVQQIDEHLGPILRNENIKKIGQNLKYDLHVLYQAGLAVHGVWFDTMIASFLLDSDRSSHSLDSLSRTLLGHEMIPISDLIGKGKNQLTMDSINLDQACEYAAEDADFTLRLQELFEPKIAGSHVEKLFYETEMPLVEILADMERTGIALDTDLLTELSKSLSDRMVELTKQIHQAAQYSFNIDSTKQLAVVLFDEQQLRVVRKTKTGRSTDADTLQTLCDESDNPIPPLVLAYRECAKLLNTYVDTLPKMINPKTNRVHATFNQIGAVTGRLSSRDPNLQNIPIRTETGKKIRKAFIAGDPKNVLLIADYSQVELRLLAHFCQDPALIEAFEQGQDIHRAVAAQVNSVALDEVTSQQRSAAKAVNFGIIYGQSAFGLARSLGIPVGEAKTFIDMYFMRYPGIRMYIDDCVHTARKTGYAETILGRRRAVPQLQSRNKAQIALGERLAVNTVVQGSAADLIKRAMIDIYQAKQSGELTAQMLIQVHDELVFEVEADQVEPNADMVKAKMENAMSLRVPIVADVSWGQSWADCK